MNDRQVNLISASEPVLQTKSFCSRHLPSWPLIFVVLKVLHGTDGF